MNSSNSTNATHYELVGEFHSVFGHPLNKEPQRDIFNTNPALVKLRYDLIKEEIDELNEAFKNHDIVECVDALCDILYVVFGAYHVFGVNYDLEYGMINHLSYYIDNYNITMAQELKLNRILFGMSDDEIELNNGELKLNHLNQLIELKSFNKHTSLIMSRFKKILNDLTNIHLKSLSNNIKYKCLNGVIHDMFNIANHCYVMGYILNVDMNKCFNEVQRSNMTKTCTREEDAIESVRVYKDEKGVDTYYELKGSYYVIYRTSDRKILKSIYFEEPNLKQFISYL